MDPKLNRIRNRRGYYYKKILFSILLSLFAIISVLSVVMLLYTNRRIRQSNLRLDEITGRHMRSSVEYMYNSAETVCKQIYASKNARLLMYQKAPANGKEMDAAIKRMNGIKASVIDVDNYIDSFAIYSQTAGRTYASRNGLDYEDPDLTERIRKGEIKSPLLRMVRDYPGNSEKPVLTFSLVDSNSDGSISNGVFVNINVSWLNSKLSTLINENELEDSCILLTDRNGNIVTSVGSRIFVSDEGLRQLDRYITDKKNVSLEPDTVSGENCYVSAVQVPRQGMMVLRIQKASLVNSSQRAFLAFAVAAFVCCIVLSVIIAKFITDSLYRPIEGLAVKAGKNIRGRQFDNEIELLNQEFESIGTIREDLDDTRKKIALYETFTALPSEEAGTEYISGMENLKIDPSGKLTAAIVRVDNDEMYDQSGYSAELARKLTEGYRREIVRIDILTTVCIVQTDDDSVRRSLIDKAEKICASELEWQTYIIAIGDITENFSHIHEAYEAVNTLVSRRYFADERDVILSRDAEIGTGGENVWDDDAEVYKAEAGLLDVIKAGSCYTELEKHIDAYLVNFRNYEYADMGVLRSHLIRSVKEMLSRINPMRSIPVTPDYRAFDAAFFNTSNLIQLKAVLLEFLVPIVNELKTDKEDKYADLVRLIKEFIEKEYGDSNLCLTSVSEAVNLSPNYVGKLFKGRTGMSVSAYITDVRLTHAAELIENSNLKINVILEHVGFTNQSSFYKSFKQKYNVTPKDYVISIRNKGAE